MSLSKLIDLIKGIAAPAPQPVPVPVRVKPGQRR